jgi:hypothetical protein
VALPDRFWSKVLVGGECWLWTAAKDAAGYGYYWHDQKVQRAHRLAFVDAGNTIADGHHVHHECGVIACVNPAHLTAIDAATHQRLSNGGRHMAARTECPRGHAYDEENTRVYKGRRWCRACDRARRVRA